MDFGMNYNENNPGYFKNQTDSIENRNPRGGAHKLIRPWILASWLLGISFVGEPLRAEPEPLQKISLEKGSDSLKFKAGTICQGGTCGIRADTGQYHRDETCPFCNSHLAKQGEEKTLKAGGVSAPAPVKRLPDVESVDAETDMGSEEPQTDLKKKLAGAVPSVGKEGDENFKALQAALDSEFKPKDNPPPSEGSYDSVYSSDDSVAYFEDSEDEIQDFDEDEVDDVFNFDEDEVDDVFNRVSPEVLDKLFKTYRDMFPDYLLGTKGKTENSGDSVANPNAYQADARAAYSDDKDKDLDNEENGSEATAGNGLGQANNSSFINDSVNNDPESPYGYMSEAINDIPDYSARFEGMFRDEPENNSTNDGVSSGNNEPGATDDQGRSDG